SSRRRHTSFSRDWSSDVCSSDLIFERMVGIKLRPLVAYLFNGCRKVALKFEVEITTFLSGLDDQEWLHRVVQRRKVEILYQPDHLTVFFSVKELYLFAYRLTAPTHLPCCRLVGDKDILDVCLRTGMEVAPVK